VGIVLITAEETNGFQILFMLLPMGDHPFINGAPPDRRGNLIIHISKIIGVMQ
jgi:hypothetical protein